MRRRCFVSRCVLAATIMAGCGCDRTPAGPSPAPGRSPEAGDAAQAEVRIVSFSPAMTRIAADLGAGRNVVGRTPWCSAVDESVPVVGDLNDINYEMLTRLRPTHIFIQPPQGGVPAELSNLAAKNDWQVTSAHIDSIAEIASAVDAVADALSIDPSGKSGPPRRYAKYRIELAQLQRGDRTGHEQVNQPLGPVLLLYMTDPPSVFGAGTYLDDVLTHLGYTNATEARGWAQLTLEDVTRINPAAILFIQPGAPVDVEVMKLLGPVGALEIDAVRDRRIAVIRHADALLPTTSVIEVAEEMRAALAAWSVETPSGS